MDASDPSAHIAALLDAHSLPPPCRGTGEGDGEGVVLLDADGTITAADRRGLHLLAARPEEATLEDLMLEDVTPEDVEGRSFQAVVPAAMAQAVAEARESVHGAEHGGGPVRVDVETGVPGAGVRMRAYPAGDGLAVYVDALRAGARDAPGGDEEKQKRLEMALAGGDLGAWELHLESGRTLYSRRWAEMLGYDLEEVESTADFFYRHVHPDDRERVRAAVEACKRGEQEMMDLEIRMRHKDGSWRWILDRGKILEWSDDGRPLRMVGTHMDVTERKRAKEALRRERDLLQRVFEASPAAIVVLNREGEMVRASERAQEILGLHPDEVEGRRYNDPEWGITDASGDPIPDEELPFRRVMEEEVSVFDAEHAVRLPDGERRLLSVNGAPLYAGVDEQAGVASADDAEPTGAVFVLEDVTERREAQQALRRSEERFRAASEQAVDVVAIFDADGTFRYLSPSVERVTGIPREALIGTDGFAPVHPEDVATLRDAFERALDDPTTTVEAECRYRRRDGTWRYLSIRGRQISTPSEEPQVLANVRDVTEERRRREELREAKEAAEEASRLKSAMLANVSHEVRTPLTSIIGFAELLAEADLGGECDRFATLIYKSGNRLLDTLNLILNLSRLEAGSVEPAPRRVQLAPLIDEVAALMEGRARARGVALTSACTVSTAQVDPDILRRILTNLIGNAIKFTEAGGEVAIRAEAETVDGEPSVCITVEDTGIGMESGFVEEAFEAFRQESVGDNRQFEGSGLGLTIVRQYVDLLGGRIAIDSEKGVGTTVTVCFPRAGRDEE